MIINSLCSGAHVARKPAPVVGIALALLAGIVALAAEAAAREGVRETPVGFASHSPFSLADVGRGPERDPPTRAVAVLFEPSTPAAARPRPAVILLHGAAGVLAPREIAYGRRFAERGIAALVVDAFASRRDRGRGFVERLLNITEAMLIADAYAGLRFLAGRAGVDPRRVALIGFSYGGMAAMYAAYAQVAERYAGSGLRFAAHVAYYAPCIADFEDDRTTGAPLLMLSGSEDAIVDAERCRAVAEEMRAGGSIVERIEYAGGYHQWDGRFDGPFKIGRNLAPCRFRVGRDGTVRDRRTFLPIVNPFFRKVALALCADDEGYLIGRSARIRARSDRDVARFLRRALAPGDPA